MGDLFTDDAVAARRRANERALFIGKDDLEPVNLELQVVALRGTTHLADTLIKGAYFLLRKSISKRPLRYLMPHFFKYRECLAHHAPRDRIGARELGILLFKPAQLAIERIVGTVRELRRIKCVVLVGVVGQELTELFRTFRRLPGSHIPPLYQPAQ